jgi:lambda family phage portal protein
MQFNNPSRPNAALDPFMRYMLREVAAGTGVSYESLSRDYSQSNYSSSRLALLDDRDLWRMLQQWFLRNFRLPLHREWMQMAVLARAIMPIRVEEYGVDPRKFDAVLFKPRGWSWVDPTKEVEAYKEAIKAGFTTVSDVIAQTGGGQDVEDVITTRTRELALFKQAALVFDTSPEVYVAKEKPAPIAEPKPKKDDKDGDDPPDKDDEESRTSEPQLRLV